MTLLETRRLEGTRAYEGEDSRQHEPEIRLFSELEENCSNARICIRTEQLVQVHP